MRKSKFTESQIVGILGEGEAGLPVAEICRKHGVSNATYYQWKSKYSGVSASEFTQAPLNSPISTSEMEYHAKNLIASPLSELRLFGKCMLPNFLIIGAARSGTTTLYYQLQRHPDIYLPRNKRPEPHFFFKASEYERGLAYYSKRYFLEWAGEKAVGEASTSYLFGNKTPKLVVEALPDVRVIVMLRNPIDRAHSNYWHTVSSGMEKLTFVEAIAREDERTIQNEGTPLAEIKPFSYLARGMYCQQIENWLAYLDRSKMHFIVFDDFISDQSAVIGDVLKFLGLPSNELVVDNQRVENRSVPQGADLLESTQELMRRYFYKDVEKLGIFLNRDLSYWLA